MVERIARLLERGREFSPRVSRARVTVGAAMLLACLMAGAIAPRWIAFAQELAFDAASVKPNKSGQPAGRVNKTPGRFIGTNASAKSLIRQAYNIQDYQFSGGPDWLDTDRFDVEGKAAGATDDDQLRAMLRTLLAERFKLVVHREAKEMPVYNLAVGKGGVKFPEIKPGQPRPASPPRMEGAAGGFMAANLSALANALSSPHLLGRPVLDKTGLTGSYLIDIQYGPDADLVALVQEQGLKLESVKGSIEMLVIDHVEKPDAN